MRGVWRLFLLWMLLASAVARSDQEFRCCFPEATWPPSQMSCALRYQDLPFPRVGSTPAEAVAFCAAVGAEAVFPAQEDPEESFHCCSDPAAADDSSFVVLAATDSMPRCQQGFDGRQRLFPFRGDSREEQERHARKVCWRGQGFVTPSGSVTHPRKSVVYAPLNRLKEHHVSEPVCLAVNQKLRVMVVDRSVSWQDSGVSGQDLLACVRLDRRISRLLATIWQRRAQTFRQYYDEMSRLCGYNNLRLGQDSDRKHNQNQVAWQHINAHLAPLFLRHLKRESLGLPILEADDSDPIIARFWASKPFTTLTRQDAFDHASQELAVTREDLVSVLRDFTFRDWFGIYREAGSRHLHTPVGRMEVEPRLACHGTYNAYRRLQDAANRRLAAMLGRSDSSQFLAQEIVSLGLPLPDTEEIYGSEAASQDRAIRRVGSLSPADQAKVAHYVALPLAWGDGRGLTHGAQGFDLITSFAIYPEARENLREALDHIKKYEDASVITEVHREVAGRIGMKPILVAWSFQLVDGMAALHHAGGMAHRDVKLENILVYKDGTLKIGDIGSSVSGSDPSIWKGVEGMTEPLLSPGIGAAIHDANRTVNRHASTDVWALGIALYRLRLGRYPYADGAASTWRKDWIDAARLIAVAHDWRQLTEQELLGLIDWLGLECTWWDQLIVACLMPIHLVDSPMAAERGPGGTIQAAPMELDLRIDLLNLQAMRDYFVGAGGSGVGCGYVLEHSFTGSAYPSITVRDIGRPEQALRHSIAAYYQD